MKLQGSHTSKLYFLNFIVLLKINIRFSGKDHRRHPYILSMHSISNRNFEIHIFALLTFRRKFLDVTELPPHKNLVPEIKSRLPVFEEMRKQKKRVAPASKRVRADATQLKTL
jgi:hypothetical protein